MNLCAITIRAEGKRVKVVMGLDGALYSAGRAIELGRCLLRAPAQGEGIEARVEVRFPSESGPFGGLVPAGIARKIGTMLVQQGRLAEEHEQASRLVFEEAALIRGGLPFRLAHDPGIKAEAFKASQHDRDLRRYLPPIGPESLRAVGTPSIIDHGNGPKRIHVEVS